MRWLFASPEFSTFYADLCFNLMNDFRDGLRDLGGVNHELYFLGTVVPSDRDVTDRANMFRTLLLLIYLLRPVF